MKRLWHLMMLTLITLWSAPTVRGQVTEELAADLYQKDTIAFASIDLSAIESVEIADFVVSALNLPGPNASQQLSSGIDELLGIVGATGASRAYIMVPAEAIFSGSICVILPTETPSKRDGFLKLYGDKMRMPTNYALLAQEKRIVICPKSMENRFKGHAQLADNPMLKSVPQGYPHWLTIAIPENLRQALATTFPDRLPEDMGIDFSPKTFAKEVKGIALGWALPPKPKMELIVQTDGSEEATRAKAQIENALAGVFASFSKTAKMTASDEGQLKLTADSKSVNALLNDVGKMMQPAGLAMNRLSGLKNIVLAMHNYHDQNGRFPAKAIFARDGRPLLSWRVTLLPLIEQEELYNQFKLDEPWDSPHNRQLLSKMPEIFKSGTALDEKGLTRYRLPVIRGGIWEGTQARSFRQVTDGTSNTVIAAIAPADKAIEWTRPDDWNLSEKTLIQDFFGPESEVEVGMADGAVRKWKRNDLDPAMLRYLIQCADGNPVFVPQ